MHEFSFFLEPKNDITMDHLGNSCARLAVQMRISTAPRRTMQYDKIYCMRSQLMKTLNYTSACNKKTQTILRL